MPGPKPKPTSIRLPEGNVGHRAVRNEPKPRSVLLDCPPFLNDAAKAIWAALVPELDYMGALTRVDESELVEYRAAYAEAQRPTRFPQRRGCTFRTTRGYVGQRPEVAILHKCWDRTRRAGAELGIGVASRARIPDPPPPPTEMTALERVRLMTRRLPLN